MEAVENIAAARIFFSAALYFVRSKKGWAGLLSTGELSNCWEIINLGLVEVLDTPVQIHYHIRFYASSARCLRLEISWVDFNMSDGD